VGVHRVQIDGAATSKSAFREYKLASIRGKDWVQCHADESLQAGSIHIHDPDVGRFRSVLVGIKSHAFPVRRDGGATGFEWRVSQTSLMRTVGIHDPQSRYQPASLAPEHDLVSIGRVL